MPREAAGKYLEILRHAKGLTAEDVGRMIGFSGKQILRWEHGTSEPPATGLHAYLHLVNGSILHIDDLLLDEQATVEDGMEKAARHLKARRQFADEIENERDLDDLIAVWRDDLEFRSMIRRKLSKWRTKTSEQVPSAE